MEYRGSLDGRCTKWPEYVYRMVKKQPFNFSVYKDSCLYQDIQIEEYINFWAQTSNYDDKHYLMIWLVPSKYKHDRVTMLIDECISHRAFTDSEVNDKILKAIYG